MKTLKEKDKQSFLARKEEVYSLIMEMGSLLADYDHQWSNELRRKFERATSFLSSKGTYAHWLNCVTSISYNRYKQVMEVECNECTSKLFVDIIKSICKISEQVKSFINPEQIKAIAESNEPILLLSNN